MPQKKDKEGREMKRIVPLGLIFLIVMFVFTWAYAGDAASQGGDAQASSSGAKDWTFNLTPFYLWAVSMDGDVTLGSNTGDFGADFGDIIDKLEAAFIVNFQGLYQNRWGFIFDYNYMGFSDSGTIPASIAGMPVSISQDADIDVHLVELDGFCRLTHEKHDFDFKFGFRYTSFDPEIKIGPQQRTLGEKQSWVDPLVGMRWMWHFADRWTLIVNGDIGGFGIGTDFSWQAGALLNWQPFKHVSFVAGYRALYQDYDDDTLGTPSFFDMEATYHGPLLGVSFSW
jgi:hypothetical protein